MAKWITVNGEALPNGLGITDGENFVRALPGRAYELSDARADALVAAFGASVAVVEAKEADKLNAAKPEAPAADEGKPKTGRR